VNVLKQTLEDELLHPSTMLASHCSQL